MNEERFQAMIVAYFLSREDKYAYDALGYGTQTATHEAVGRRFGVNPNTVKNWRDEFDGVHENTRQGWHQRPLRPSRASVVARYGELSFDGLHALVKRLLIGPSTDLAVEVPVSALTPEKPSADEGTEEFESGLTRGITGRAAEAAFVHYYETTSEPVAGRLIDCRDSGEGYDYEIETPTGSVFIEVKGLAGARGSVSLTSREWITARSLKDRYYIALVLQTHDAPRVILFRDPGTRLNPKLRLVSVLQEQWSLSSSSISQGPT